MGGHCEARSAEAISSPQVWRCRIAAALLFSSVSGCAVSPAPATPAASQPTPYSCLLPTEHRMLVAELFFGRGIKGRAPLSGAEWAEFAAQTITPNFPDGFTVFDGEGQWRNPADRTHRPRPDQNPVGRGQTQPRSRAPAGRGDRRLQTQIPSAIGRPDHPRLLRRVLATFLTIMRDTLSHREGRCPRLTWIPAAPRQRLGCQPYGPPPRPAGRGCRRACGACAPRPAPRGGGRTRARGTRAR